MDLTQKKGVSQLTSEVVDAGLCTVCGACAGVCPYIRVYREKVSLLDLCGLNEGQCYEVCPRTATDWEAINQSVFGVGRDDFVLGTKRKMVFGRAADAGVRREGQYGGAVSALTQFVLASRIADAALLAGRNPNFPLLPEPMVAKTPDDVTLAAGSKYSACPTLSVLEKSLRESGTLAVVGRGCQVAAIRKKQMLSPEASRIKIVIGLFCMWALDYREIESYLAPRVELSRVKKYDIPEGDFVVYTDDGTKRFPFEEIKSRRRATCDLCYDFTNEMADISVGATESENDWNTVVVRSAAGEKLWNDALGAGVVEEKPFPESRVPVLRNAALGKKKRVVAALREKFGTPEAIFGYLKLGEKEAGGYK